MGRPARWVKERMAAGEIPSVKIGNRRFFTKECRARLIQMQLEEDKVREEGWGQVTRGQRRVPRPRGSQP